METNNNLTIVPERGTIVSTSERIIDNEHPNFIESNTQAVTMEELNRCIVPTFSDSCVVRCNEPY